MIAAILGAAVAVICPGIVGTVEGQDAFIAFAEGVLSLAPSSTDL
jgi:hypothetical protein